VLCSWHSESRFPGDNAAKVRQPGGVAGPIAPSL
jgi:hypothetical protein